MSGRACRRSRGFSRRAGLLPQRLLHENADGVSASVSGSTLSVTGSQVTGSQWTASGDGSPGDRALQVNGLSGERLGGGRGERSHSDLEGATCANWPAKDYEKQKPIAQGSCRAIASATVRGQGRWTRSQSDDLFRQFRRHSTK